MAVTNNFTDTITTSYTGNGKAVSIPTGTYTGKFDAGIAAVIPAGSVNLQLTVVFPFATIQSCAMSSTQAVTVKTNSSTTPGNTFALTGTAGLVWGSDFVTANPFTANVTTLFISNLGATDSTFNLRVLYN